MSEKLTFEKAFARLVEISNILEDYENPLESSLKLYEEATKLRKFCEDFISNAKKTINKLNIDSKESTKTE
ncbi:exodeoxyribonuclease VII small subunit [Candidatus Deianiraea vastatrix]|uniref:Exodeoxyribonuclease 7 small subunit n=1 Tax=Candidatus Deianiraea vastatrix TaxID=2163644 RepID=A0A5B8XIJ6_9RICK|nr:exodeoxyribonuclease VII small subunit [Candidatus Deianiraea vastatrix]QED23487.1 Exodeoxyribonuclease 7 small subunit [Candidatus Deianiraea vastatrix]